MSTYSLIAGLPLVVESYELEGLEQAVSSDFVRRTTVIRLHGRGEEGVGEDVIYDADDQLRLQAAGPVLDLAGTHTLDSLSAPRSEGLPDYRRWGFESAALDLALRQAGASAARGARARAAAGHLRRLAPRSPTATPARLRSLPGMRFKLDPTSDWDGRSSRSSPRLGTVDVVDFKEAYDWRDADSHAAAEPLPDRSIDALAGRPDRGPGPRPTRRRPRSSRRTTTGSRGTRRSTRSPTSTRCRSRRRSSTRSRRASARPRRCSHFYDTCAERGIALYGGGQFELGPGRGQIQYLASLFHPDAANDVAPGEYNLVPTPPGLPTSPLPASAAPVGFRWLQG